MKCAGCGFECNEKYCPMCGAKMPEHIDYNANPYAADVDNNAAEKNYSSVNTNPYNINVNPPYSNNQHTFNNSNPIQSNYVNGQPNPNQGCVPPYSVNTNPMQMNAMPNQYACPPKKKGKVFPIVIISIVIGIVLAGAILGICSAFMYNKSIADSFVNGDSYDSGYDDMYYDDYSDTELIEDYSVYKINETKELPNCEIALKKAERVEGVNTAEEGNSRMTVTFEIKNTTDRYVVLDYIGCDAYETSDLKYPEYYFEWISDNLTEESTFELEPNETKELTIDFSVPNSVENMDLDLNITSYQDNYDYYGYFTTKK